MPRAIRIRPAVVAAILACAGGCSLFPTSAGSRDLALVWTRPVRELGAAPDPGGWHGEPSISGGTALVDVGTGIAALKISDGATVWVNRLWSGRRGSAATGRIVAAQQRALLAAFGFVHALNIHTGATNWTTPVDSIDHLSANETDGSMFYVGTRGPGLYASATALDVATGAVRWRTPVNAPDDFASFVNGFAISGDTVYATATKYTERWGRNHVGIVLALDRATGRELWRYRSPGNEVNREAITDAPAIAGPLLLISDGDAPAVYALDRATGREVWRVRTDPAYVGPYERPHVAGDTAFFASGDRYIYAVQASTGRIYWKYRARGSILDMALCGRWILGNTYAIEVVDRGTGRGIATLIDPEKLPIGSGFATSAFAVERQANGSYIAVVTGTKDVYGIRCPG